jgi:predicted MFS family arabinose efflux permease
MFHVTNKSLIADLVPVEKRGRINALLVVFSTAGSIAVWVPALILLPEGEGTYSREIHMLFIGGGALILVLVGIFVWQLVKEPKITTPPHNWFKDLTNLFDRKEMAKNKDFLRLFLAMMFLITSESAFFPFLLILLQEIPLDFSGMIVPFVIVIAGVGLGIFLIGRGVDVVGRKPIALICLIISPIGCLILTFFGTNYLGLIIGFGVMMPFYMGIWLTTDSWTLDLLPEQSRGRFLGIKNIGNAVGKVPGVLLAGFLADQFGILWVFFVAGIILWIAIPFFLKVPETLKREKVK